MFNILGAFSVDRAEGAVMKRRRLHAQPPVKGCLLAQMQRPVFSEHVGQFCGAEGVSSLGACSRDWQDRALGNEPLWQGLCENLWAQGVRKAGGMAQRRGRAMNNSPAGDGNGPTGSSSDATAAGAARASTTPTPTTRRPAPPRPLSVLGGRPWVRCRCSQTAMRAYGAAPGTAAPSVALVEVALPGEIAYPTTDSEAGYLVCEPLRTLTYRESLIASKRDHHHRRARGPVDVELVRLEWRVSFNPFPPGMLNIHTPDKGYAVEFHPDGFMSDSIYFDARQGARFGLKGGRLQDHMGLEHKLERTRHWTWEKTNRMLRFESRHTLRPTPLEPITGTAAAQRGGARADADATPPPPPPPPVTWTRHGFTRTAQDALAAARAAAGAVTDAVSRAVRRN